VLHTNLPTLDNPQLGLLEAVSRLLELGLTAEQIAIALNLELDLVQQTIQAQV
jgi:predicted transposase YdaD